MPSGLPIDAALPALDRALAGATRVVLHAPPGAGKSTVVPLALLEAPWLAGRRIVMLEPRRLAARSIAQRMACTLGEPLGERVGYRIRLDSRVGPRTRIEVVTEGILTRRLQEDPALEGVGCVVFDEFHERSLNADLGLALCLDAQAGLREDLRLLVMSATLDAETLARHLENAPVVACAGATHPVRTLHLGRPAEGALVPAVAAAVRRALAEEQGDLLVFLPGVGEIRQVERALGAAPAPHTRVLSLYGELGQAAQDEVLRPAAPGRRKVVLATSIAETSLTIEGVRVVVDAGLARRARFDPGTGMTRLETLPVSRAAADQRRGRAGRLAPGVCYRLWSEEAEARLAAFTPPEILEADLAPLALELAVWGASDPGALRWLTPPPEASYGRARELLQALEALDPGGRVTPQGRRMARLGVHPRLAHMLLRGRELGLGAPAAELAAVLAERDLLRLPPGERRTDLRLRLEALRGDLRDLPAGAQLDRASRERARQLAQLWGEARAEEPTAATAGLPAEDAPGVLVALAYPDRVARARPGSRGRYVLANGRGAVLPAADPLAREPFLAVAELDAGEREARVYTAAPLSRATLERVFAAELREEETTAWDAEAGAVVALRVRRLGRLALTEKPLDPMPAEAAVEAMLEGVRRLGLGALPWTSALRAWRARVAWLARLDAPGLGAWPDVSDAALLQRLPEWLGPYLAGVTRREHLARLPLAAALESLLEPAQRRRLESLAPTHLIVPSGSRIALDYEAEDAPALSARLQEMFGLTDTPRVAEGRVPVTVRLLSPAGRPVQVTRDLASFWASGYFEVRKELKGRYPRHYWPDDPRVAEATRRVRPRGH